MSLALAPAIFADEPAKETPAVEPAEPSLDELLNLPKQPDKPADRPSPDKIEDEKSSEPFILAVEGMKQASDRLRGKSDTGIETQRIQKQVVTRLDAIIAEQKKKQQQSSSSSKQRKQDAGSQQPGEPMPQPGEQSTPTNDPKAGSRQTLKETRPGDAPLEEELIEWGNLPDRLREELTQGHDDRYSDLYKLLTQKYYRRLAEESKP